MLLNSHRMLSYGALLENYTGQIFFNFIHGTPWFVRTFHTPLAVLAAKGRNERKCGTTAGAATTSYRCTGVGSVLLSAA